MSLSKQDAVDYLRKQVPDFAKKTHPIIVSSGEKIRWGEVPTLKDVEDVLYDLLLLYVDGFILPPSKLFRIEKFDIKGEEHVRIVFKMESDGSPVMISTEELAVKSKKEK